MPSAQQAQPGQSAINQFFRWLRCEVQQVLSDFGAIGISDPAGITSTIGPAHVTASTIAAAHTVTSTIAPL